MTEKNVEYIPLKEEDTLLFGLPLKGKHQGHEHKLYPVFAQKSEFGEIVEIDVTTCEEEREARIVLVTKGVDGQIIAQALGNGDASDLAKHLAEAVNGLRTLCGISGVLAVVEAHPIPMDALAEATAKAPPAKGGGH